MCTSSHFLFLTYTATAVQRDEAQRNRAGAWLVRAPAGAWLAVRRWSMACSCACWSMTCPCTATIFSILFHLRIVTFNHLLKVSIRKNYKTGIPFCLKRILNKLLFCIDTDLVLIHKYNPYISLKRDSKPVIFFYRYS